ncbi:MAG: hypothetical protein GF405_06685 [Candidatus Eisenbacteria bacterium]|nr:hypothetical protein [Candidatus Eisenbacteria bacterium]
MTRSIESILVAVLVALSLFSAPDARAGELDAAALAASVADRYASLSAYALDFVQTSYWSLADSTVSTSGTLRVERPGRIAVSYGTGGRIVIVGDSLKAYAPESRQFFVARVDTTSSVIDPARLLRSYRTDPETPVLPPQDDPRFGGPPPEGAVTLALLPRDPLAEPSRLVVRVAPASLRVLAILAVAAGGDWTRYDIVDERPVNDHPQGAFALRRPEGAELVTGMPFGGF